MQTHLLLGVGEVWRVRAIRDYVAPVVPCVKIIFGSKFIVVNSPNSILPLHLFVLFVFVLLEKQNTQFTNGYNLNAL